MDQGRHTDEGGGNGHQDTHNDHDDKQRDNENKEQRDDKDQKPDSGECGDQDGSKSHTRDTDQDCGQGTDEQDDEDKSDPWSFTSQLLAELICHDQPSQAVHADAGSSAIDYEWRMDRIKALWRREYHTKLYLAYMAPHPCPPSTDVADMRFVLVLFSSSHALLCWVEREGREHDSTVKVSRESLATASGWSSIEAARADPDTEAMAVGWYLPPRDQAPEIYARPAMQGLDEKVNSIAIACAVIGRRASD